MNGCPNTERLLGWIAGEATPAEASHVASCAACQRRVLELRRVGAAIERMPVRKLSACPPPGQATESHLADCDVCLEAHLALRDAETVESAPAPSRLLAQRARALVRPAVTSSRSRPRVSRRIAPPRPQWGWPIAAAAAALLAVVLLYQFATRKREPKPDAVAVQPPPAPTPRETPAPRPPERPRIPTPEPGPAPEVPTPGPEAPAPEPETPTPQPETPPPETPPETTPEPGPSLETETRPVLARLTDVHGAAICQRTDTSEPVSEGMEIAAADVIRTTDRERARFRIDDRVTLTLRESTELRITPGELSATLAAGEVLAQVTPGSGGFVVATAHADAIVTGTVFLVRVSEAVTELAVLEGSVEFRSDRRSVSVTAGQRVAAARGRFTRPEPVDPVAARWAESPDVTDTPPATAFLDFVAGDPRGPCPGILVSRPYADWEVGACDIGRRVADRLRAAQVIGYRYRNYDDQIWVAIDRGTEALYDEQGNRGNPGPTDRAEGIYREWLQLARHATGVARGPIPLIAVFRNHSERVDGEPLRVIEVATNGLSRAAMEEVRAQYERLLAEQAPDERFDLRIDLFDRPDYPYCDARRTFLFTEVDAKEHGYMEAQNSRRAVAFFFPTTQILSDGDRGKYAAIMAELVRILYSAR